MSLKDGRIKLMNQILSGVKVSFLSNDFCLISCFSCSDLARLFDRAVFTNAASNG